MDNPNDPFGSASSGAPVPQDTGTLSEELAREDTSQLNVEIPESLHRRLRVYCVQTDQHVKDVVARLIEEHLSS